jgi:DNA-binding transcriptional MerR regulator
MPISEMRRFAERTRQGTATASERRELLEAHRLRVVAQLQEIQHTLARLDTKIAHVHAVEIEQEQETEKVGAKR